MLLAPYFVTIQYHQVTANIYLYQLWAELECFSMPPFPFYKCLKTKVHNSQKPAYGYRAEAQLAPKSEIFFALSIPFTWDYF